MLFQSLFSNRDQILGQALFDAVPMIEFSQDGVIVTANAAFLKILGYVLSDIVGQTYMALADPVTIDSGRAKKLWTRVSEGTAATETIKLKAYDGGVRWMQVYVLPVKNPVGRVDRVLLTGCDITDIKQKEQVTRELLETLTNTQAVAEFCPKGNLLYANATFLEVMGYGLNEIVGRPHRILCEYDYGLSCEYADFWDGLAAGRACQNTYVRYGKGGISVNLKASYTPVFDDKGAVDKVAFFATLIEDKPVVNLQKVA